VRGGAADDGGRTGPAGRAVGAAHVRRGC
jgi:hypothetical protein